MQKNDPSARQRLTALFTDTSGHKIVHREEISISYMTAVGAQMEIHTETPALAAAYIRAAMSLSSPPLLARHDALGIINIPLIFKARGEIFVPETKDISNGNLLARLRFSRPEDLSELCFDDDFPAGNDQIAQSWDTGPTMNEFLGILDRAGADWRKVDFTPKTAGLRLVPRT